MSIFEVKIGTAVAASIGDTERQPAMFVHQINDEFGNGDAVIFGTDDKDLSDDEIIELLKDQSSTDYADLCTFQAEDEMRYIVYDQIRSGDLFTEDYADRETAIRAARAAWDGMSDHDRARRETFGVLESINPDPEAENHLDGNFIWRAY